jgi:EpsI family protein
VILFLLAWILLFFQPKKMSLTEALDIETDGLSAQAARIRHVRPSAAMIAAAAIGLANALAFQLMPDRSAQTVLRDNFAIFPQSLGNWKQRGIPQSLEDSVVATLAADDYHSVVFAREDGRPEVGVFMAWYADLQENGTHSPEVCLPGAGWEISWIERTDLAEDLGTETAFNVNRVIIQRGETRMMVYYWFQHGDRRIAWDIMQKLYLLLDGIRTGSVHGGIVRLTTLIDPNESEAEAEARLQNILSHLQEPLPRFFPPY